MKKDLTPHQHIQERVTKAKLDQIVARVVDLMSSNHTTKQICDILCKELNKSEAQIRRYVSKAQKQLQIDFERDATIKRMEMEQSYRGDLVEAYRVYNALTFDHRMKPVWYKLILETKAKIQSFLPEETEDKGQSIQVTYKVVE